MIGRFAGQAFRAARAYGLPRTAGGLAARVLPDAAFAGLYALTAPEDYAQTPLERAGLFAQDFILGAGSGMLTSGIASNIGHHAGWKRGRIQRAAGIADMTGSVVGPMATYSLGLAPMTAYLDRRAESNAEAQAEQEREGAFQAGLDAAGRAITESPQVESIDRLTQMLAFGSGLNANG